MIDILTGALRNWDEPTVEIDHPLIGVIRLPREQIEETEDRPGVGAEELFPALQVDTRRGNVAAQTIHRQQTQREQEPLAEVRYPKYVRERFK